MASADVLKPDFATRRRHFIFTDEHDQMRDSIRRFLTGELQPHAEEWEETTFPDWVFERMDDLRLNRIGAGSDEIRLEVIGRSYGL